MTVVACTDELVERQLQQLGLFGPLLVRALADQLREERTRVAALDVGARRGVVWSREAEADASERIDFRPRARPRFELRLGHYGVEAMRRELVWAAPEGIEAGGYLWSHHRARQSGVVIAHVSPPAEGSRHSPTSVRLGRVEDIAAAWPDWLARSEMVAVGDWHSHVRGDGQPSRIDLENWAERVRRSEGFQWASLIVTRGEAGFGWSAPQYAGWVTSPDGHGGYICEPAKVAYP